MGLLTMAKAKAKSTTTCGTGNGTSTSTSTSNSDTNNNGLGLLLVFFAQDNHNKTNLNFRSPSQPPSTSNSTTFRRSNSNNLIFSKAQSTISICALLLFFTLLLFTLSTFEPTIPNATPRKPPTNLHLHIPTPKSHGKTQNWFPHSWQKNKSQNGITSSSRASSSHSHALQRMGTLYRRGTRAMTDLLICHVADETAENDFRFFLRLIHRSGLTAKSDVVFLFSCHSLSSVFAPIIYEENDAFSSLIELHAELNSTQWSQYPESSFDLTRFFYKGADIGESLWGKKTRSNLNLSREDEKEGELIQLNGGSELLSYGSILSFDATELDPENSLSGFLGRVPLSLRRWACYPMLLGRVRRNFKHVMLVDVKNVLVLKDPLGRVRNRSPESVFLFAKHNKNSDKTRLTQQHRVDSGVIMGGARGVRRLCNAVLLEIVRGAMQHKMKNSVSESVILSQLVGNEFTLKSKNVNLIASTESIPEASSLGGRNSGSATSSLNYAIILRGTGNNHDLSSVIKREICSSVVDSSVYRDC